jgi:pimeloyl-ACP methyl ester carboxylesterase
VEKAAAPQWGRVVARIVLLHGMGCDSSQFDALRPHLPNLVTPDLHDCTVDEVRSHVERGDVLGGVSMGAALSLAYAVQPDAACSALVLIAPAGGDTARTYLDWLATTLETGGFPALRAAGEPMADFWEARFAPGYLINLWRHPPLDWVDPAAVRVPALVAAWPDDGLHPIDEARKLAARLPRHRFLELPTPSGLALPAQPLSAALSAFSTTPGVVEKARGLGG